MKDEQFLSPLNKGSDQDQIMLRNLRLRTADQPDST